MYVRTSLHAVCIVAHLNKIIDFENCIRTYVHKATYVHNLVIVV